MTWGTNDYPWPNAECGEDNPNNCNYAYRNCTDFAMWRIRHDLGLPCMALGNAGKWLDSLEELGYPHGNVPHVHDVLVLEPGEQNSNPRFGHVAMVLTASAASVSVEQYDWTPCQYSHGVFQVTPRTHFVTLVAPKPPTPPAPTGEPMQLYQDNAGTIWQFVGNSKLAVGSVADVAYLESLGWKLTYENKISPVLAAAYARMPVI